MELDYSASLARIHFFRIGATQVDLFADQMNAMKKLLFLLPMMLVYWSLFIASAAAQKRTQILFDFRATRPTASDIYSRQTQKQVLSKVFRKYLTDEKQCSQQFDSRGDADVLRAARNAGQIVPAIFDSAQGSFTGRGKQETAYVISVSECNASHADNFGTKRVAIFAGEQLVADMDVNFKSNIVRKTDLNSDGVDELLMTTGDMNQGVLIEIAALLDFEAGSVRVIEDLGTVIEDSCAAGGPGSSAKASVISLSGGGAGKFPRMRIENFESSCRRQKRWRFVSSGKMQ